MSDLEKRPQRMDGYIRVSRRMGREGPGYISPAIQREAVQRWANYRGVEIVAWHEDEDESGGTQDRPGMREAMRRVMEGETDGIACWRLNRFARNVSEALADVKRIHGRQPTPGALAFVEEEIDPTGPFGEFILTVLLAVAALELNNIRAGWRSPKERAHGRGAKIGPTPLGYVRREDGELDVHPERGPLVAEAFTRAAEQGLQAALEYLSDLGLVHESGKRKGRALSWTTGTVRRLLANRTYLGELRYGDLPPYRDERLAIVPRATWEAAQPDGPRRRRPARHYPLSGVARCGSCGEAMVGGSAGANRRTYRCRASLKLWKGTPCPSPVNVLADTLEEHVRALLTDLWTCTWEAQDDAQGDLREAELALHSSEAELDDLLADVTLRRTLGAERFQRLAEANVEAVEQAQRAYREAASQAARRFTADAPELVASATPDELGELVRGGLEAIVVKRGRGRIEDRVRLVPKGAPTDAGMAATKNP
jgi:DNA invertase Pin-like site-specific DNA recombinase